MLDRAVDSMSWQQSEIENMYSAARLPDGRTAYKIGSATVYAPAGATCQPEFTSDEPAGRISANPG